jgi:hypothetical protein
MKIKSYVVYEAGGCKLEMDYIWATCISKAAKKFIATLDKPAMFELRSKQQASIRYRDNHSVMGDFVIMEV